MFIWYFTGHTSIAFNDWSNRYGDMECNESYWMVPGTEITGCLLCGSPDLGHHHFTAEDGLVVPC